MAVALLLLSIAELDLESPLALLPSLASSIYYPLILYRGLKERS